ncbi:uncharacterized protein LOC121387579 isoform X2 [Gigantopelta aegis]|nr:uncharacterized protein LOC121387579 isoform X2 [Gigantopelta aegis]
MKLVWTLVVMCVMLDLVVTATGDRRVEPPIHYGKRLPQRTVRSILSRMAAGFGKRGSSLDADMNTAAIDDIVSLVYKNPAVARAILRKFVDANDDGAISESELFL